MSTRASISPGMMIPLPQLLKDAWAPALPGCGKE
jgi:hypothetical protein